MNNLEQEIGEFWQGKSTNLLGGGCNAEPLDTKDRPEKVVKPNCELASSCLWCGNYRDIESFDYVWTLLSYRELMFIEKKAGVWLVKPIQKQTM